MKSVEAIALAASGLLVIAGFIFVARYARAKREGRPRDARRALRTAALILPVCLASIGIWSYTIGGRF